MSSVLSSRVTKTKDFRIIMDPASLRSHNLVSERFYVIIIKMSSN